jgi:hypothetical protein
MIHGEDDYLKPRHVIGFLAAIGLTFGQTLVDLKTQTKNVDFSRALSVRPFPTGAGLPSVCNTGQMFFKTDATSGANLYGCIAPNTWVLESAAATGPTDTISRVADEGTLLTQRATVNFIGPAIACVDNSGASRTDCIVTAGAGLIVLTTGNGDPSASCSAPSASNLAKYYDAAAKKMWTCVSANRWELDLSVDPTATLLINGNAGTAPGTPGSGTVNVYSDATLKGLSAKDDVGQITRTVKPTDCGSGFVQKLNADGTVTCAAGVGGGGGAQTIFIAPNGFQIVAAAVIYSGPGGALGASNSGYDIFRGVFPVSGTMSHLCAGIDHVTTQPADGDLVFTALKNGVPTNLSVTVPAGTAPPYYACDTTHTVAVTAVTDAISFSITNGSPGSISAFPASMSYLFQ